MQRTAISARILHPHRSAGRWGSALVALLIPAGACSSVDISNQASASVAGSGGASSSSASVGGGGASSSVSSGTGVVGPCTAGPWARDLALGASAIEVHLALGAGCTTILTGRFQGALDLGNGPLTTEGDGKGLFVAKLDQTGKTIWSRAFELLGSYASAAVTVDAQGNILLGGTFSGTLDLGGPLVSVGTSDMFVAKLDADGHPLWSSRYRGDHEIRVADVAVDAAGNLIAGGMFSGDLDFGLGVLQSGVIEHGFLVKLDPKGKPLWQKDVDSPDAATVTALAVDATGAVTFTGTFRTSIGLGFSSTAFKSSYVARCDADGALLWARQLGGDEGQMALDVAVDAAGNSVVGGMFSAKLDVGDPTIDLGLVPTMTMCCALACAIRYDSQGKVTWGHCFYASLNSLPVTYQRMNGVAFGPAGQLWMTGQFTRAINFGGGPLINPTNPYRAFVAELDADGNQLGAAEYGSNKAASGYGSSGDQIVVDPAGRAHVVGTLTGTASFDGGSLASTGDADVFVATVDF